MFHPRNLFQAAVLAWLLSFGSVPAAELISKNSTWRFRKGTSEASNPVAAWRELDFADTGFTSAPAPFWYGDPYPGGTELADMRNAYLCIFLRHPFTVANPADLGAMRMTAFIDDGFIAWINGVEVLRVNMNVAQPTFQSAASNAAEPPPDTVYDLVLPAGVLRAGTNILAVQVFNTSLNSSDLGFDCSLEAVIADRMPPVITSVTPRPGQVSALTSVTVTFSEPVRGVEADDFLINGIPAASLTGGGATYTFGFQQPLYGTVFCTFRNPPGISDLATPPNPFDAGAFAASWQYQLIDTIPPVIISQHPPPGLAVRALSQIEVTFSEAVLHVEAADLLINGQPATQLVNRGGGVFQFRFAPPSAGGVDVRWREGHGITDAALTPNPFAGAGWSYTVDPAAPRADLAITELLASSVRPGGLADQDGELQDWIEIYNRGTEPVDLAGWSLSDDPDLPGLWVFPSRTLQPNQFLLVFASGKDRKPGTGELHTNFKLGASGEHLGLYSPDSPRVLIHGYDRFPEQRNNISYGLDPAGNPRYFAVPTPGRPNGLSTLAGVCAPVRVNVRRGHFAQPFTLTASCATPEATLRYTTNGSEPGIHSTVFPGLLPISSTTLFRVAAFKEHHLPSRTETHSYLFNLPAGYRALPVISIVTDTNHLYGPAGILGINGGNYNNGPWAPNAGQPNQYHNPSKHGLAWERPTSVEWINPGDHSGFQIDCGIRVQGSDYQRPRLTPASKFSFRLYFRSDYGPGRLNHPVFPLTSVSRFDQLVLRAGFNEQSNPFIRDELHRRLSHDMGQIASHGTLAVVLVNGRAYTASPYYNPAERVHEEFFQEHLGGGRDWDVVGPSFAQSAGMPGVIDGDRADFQSLVSYVRNNPVTSQAVYTEISRRLDLVNFTDYCLLNAFAAMGDWPANNWRAGRDRAGGPWRFIVWDAEWGMGIYDRSININSFTQTGAGPNDSGLGSVASSEIAQMFDRLRASPEFRLLWADRVQKHFSPGGALTGANITNRFNELRDQLRPLIANMDTEILQWARDRQAIFFNHMTARGLLSSVSAPALSQAGGRVPAGFALQMTHPNATIYYTTDGSDPRTGFAGTPSPTAARYTSAVRLNQSATVRARAVQGDQWSALVEAAFTVAALGSPVRISEIMYNPPGGALYEFVELLNPSGSAVDLGGMSFSGISYQFPQGSTLAAGARLVLAADTDASAWRARYPGVTPAGFFSGSLNNAGERLALLDSRGQTITSVDYRPGSGWPTGANGGGYSLELLDPAGDPDDPANWRASARINGSPGEVNSAPVTPTVIINEVLAENVAAVTHAGTNPDYVELFNAGASPVSLAGWSLSDSSDPRRFVFPSGVTIPAQGYLVIWCDAAATPGLHAGFGLSRAGETVALYDAATNRVDVIRFGNQLAEFSIGRIAGEWVLNTPTPGAANAATPVGSAADLAINEWLANPPTGEMDWVELFNRSASLPVALRGVYLSNGAAFHQILAPTFIAPRGYLQLFADDAAGVNQLDFKLPASGGSISLSDSAGGLIERVDYGAQTEGVTQGRLPDGGSTIVTFTGSASPGAANHQLASSGPVINEVLARNNSILVGGRAVDFVEIHNPAAAAVSLAGMSLSVNEAAAGRWTFPAGTTLAARGYVVIACDGSRAASTTPGAFNTGESLAGDSGGVYLYNNAGQLIDRVEYGFQISDLSIGLSGGQWRLLAAPTPGAANAAAAALGTYATLKINEWLAAPASGPDGFELYNTGSGPVDLSTISLTDDPSLAGQGKFRPAPLSYIAGRDFVQWIAAGTPAAGRNHVNFALDAAGDSLVLYGVSGASFIRVDAVALAAQERDVSEGRLPDGAERIVRFPGSATPGGPNFRLLQNLFINEVLAHTDPPLEDAVELHNPTSTPVNMGGWFLSNSANNFQKYRIPNGTVVPANGYTVIYEGAFNAAGSATAFTLNSARGDEVWLSAVDAQGVMTGDRAVARFGASFNGVSFGRVLTSAGADYFPLSSRTFGVDQPITVGQFRLGTGAANLAPALSPVIISEVHYHPPDGAEEFIELHNHTAAAVDLYHPVYLDLAWKLDGAVSFTFPARTVMPPGSYALVVNFNPTSNPAALAAFRARHNIPGAVPVFGPYSGGLNNQADSVELYQSDNPQLPPHPDAGFVPYVLADRANYLNASPWPGGLANGGGHSIQRLSPGLYGNEAAHWTAAQPTPGGALPGGGQRDTDGDGIPDDDEILLGLNPLDATDGAADFDGDGISNRAEYVSGTDLRDPLSRLHISAISVGGSVGITFAAAANRSYSVLYTDRLDSGIWLKLSDFSPGTAGLRTATDPVPSGQARYYRIVTPARGP